MPRAMPLRLMLVVEHLVPVLPPQLRMMLPYIEAEDERRPIDTYEGGLAATADGGGIAIPPGTCFHS